MPELLPKWPGGRQMKTYLTMYSIQDGENAYKEYSIIEAKNQREADQIAKHEEIEMGRSNTEQRLEWTQEILPSEINTLKRFGVI